MNTSPKKVVFAINDFTYGGAQRLYIDLFEALGPQEFEIHLISLMDFPDKQDLFKEVPAHVQVHRFHFKNVKDLGEWLRLIKELRKINPAVAVTSLFFTNTVLRVLKPLIGYRVIAIEHNTYEKKTRFHIFIDRLLSHLTQTIVAVSETVRTFTSKQEKIPLEKFCVIHNGVDIERIEHILRQVDVSTLRRELGLSKDDKIIINVGRLTRQKNQGALIEAFAEFSQKYPQYKLLILGEGKLMDEYVSLIHELRVEKTIRLLGVRKDVIACCMLADFFVSASHIEGLSVAQIEALVCSLPILTTKTSGADEMIREGENGYFMEATTGDIYAGLERMVNADLDHMRIQARETAKRYDIKKTAHAYADLMIHL